MDLEEWLNRAVDHELVAENSVGVEQVEEQKPVRVEHLVGEHQRDIKVAARQPERCGVGVGLVSGVLTVEQQMNSHESLVCVLRCEVEAMIVIPHCPQGLARVAEWCVLRVGETGQDVWIVLVPEEPRIEKVAGESIAFRRSVAVVKMRRGLWYAKALMVSRQVVMHANQTRFSVPRMVSGSGESGWTKAVGESPYRLKREIGMEALQCFLFVDVVELLRQKLIPSLVTRRASLACGSVGTGGGRRVQSRYGLCGRHYWQGNYE